MIPYCMTRHMCWDTERYKEAGSIKRYNDVLRIFIKYIRKAGGAAEAESLSLDECMNKGIDIDAFLGSLHIQIDVRVTHPTADSNLRHVMRSLGASFVAPQA